MILVSLSEEENASYNSSIPRNVYLETVYESDEDRLGREEGREHHEGLILHEEGQEDKLESCCCSRSVEEQVDEKTERLYKLLTVNLWSSDATEVLQGLQELVTLCGNSSYGKVESGNSSDNDLRHELIFLGGHLAVIRAMRAFPQSPTIQIQALKLLLRLARSLNSNWLDLLGSMGIVESTIHAIKSFPHDAVLQRRAYRLLSHLFGNNNGGSRANVDRFLEQGGLPAIFERLEQQQRHSTNIQDIKEAQMQACSLFKKLSAWEHARAKMLEMGAITAVAGWIDHSNSCGDSGSTHSKSTLTTVSGSNWTSSEASSLSIVSDAALQSKACETMAKLVQMQKKDMKKQNETRQTALAATGATPNPPLMDCDEQSDDMSQLSESIASPISDKPTLVVTDQQMFIDAVTRDLLVQKDPSPVLRSIRTFLKTSRQEFGRTFLEVGGPLALAQAMATHKVKKHVQLRGYDIILELVKLDGFAGVLGDLGLVQVVVDGMAAHAASESVAKDGTHTLYELLSGSQTNVARFVVEANNGIPVLIHAMSTFVDVPKFQHRACQVIQLCLPRYKTIIVSEGDGVVMGVITRVLEHNRSHDKTARAARKCLKALR